MNRPMMNVCKALEGRKTISIKFTLRPVFNLGGGLIVAACSCFLHPQTLQSIVAYMYFYQLLLLLLKLDNIVPIPLIR